MLDNKDKVNKPLTTREKLSIIGDSGTERYSGFFYEDPNPQWRDDTRIDIIENMRRTDGTVKAALTVVKTPMVGTTWDVVTNSEDPKDIEIKDFVKKSIFDMKGRTWKEFLREALTYLDFGYSVFEKVYCIRDGRITIGDLQPRIQRSIYKWQMQNGEPGITQFTRADDVSFKTQGFIDVPMNKLVVFTNEKEGDDITGQSILRAAYKHFYAKDNLYRFGLIASERFGTGTLILTLPPDAGTEERDEAIRLGRAFKANEMAYVVKPSSEWDINILRPESTGQNNIMEDQIKHHDREILMSVLAAFLDLGSGNVGSFSLSQDQSEFFLKNVEDKLEYFSEKFTKEVVEDIVQQAYPEDFERLKEEGNLPYLTYSPIGQKDLLAVSNYLKNLIDAGIIVPDPKLRSWAHDLFQLPELTEEDLEAEEMEVEVEEENEMEEIEEEEPEEIGLSTLSLLSQKKKFELARPLTLLEEKVNYHYLNEQFNTLESQLEADLQAFFDESINNSVNKIDRKIKSEDLASIALATIISVSKLKDIIKNYSAQSLEVGKKTASEELEVERPATPSKISKINSFEANQIAETTAQRIEGKAKASIKTGILAGVTTTAILSAMINSADQEAKRSTSIITGSLIGDNINKGRKIVFDKNADLIQAYMRSEVLDSRTCNVCMSLDRRVVDAGDPFLGLSLVHNGCRGEWIAVKRNQTIDEVDGVTYGIPKTVRESFNTVGGTPQQDSFTQLNKPINRANKAVQNEYKKRTQ